MKSIFYAQIISRIILVSYGGCNIPAEFRGTGYTLSDQHIISQNQSLYFGWIGDKICWSDKEQPVCRW